MFVSVTFAFNVGYQTIKNKKCVMERYTGICAISYLILKFIS